MRTHGDFSRDAEDRIERICGGIIGFVFGAIALGTPAKDNPWLIATYRAGGHPTGPLARQ